MKLGTLIYEGLMDY